MNAKIKYLYLFLLLASILAACSAPATAVPAVIPTSTSAPTPTSVPNGAAVIAQGFWDAIIAKDIDKAMAFVADDIVTSGGPQSFSDKVKFSAFMVSGMNSGITQEISDLRIVSEDTVTLDLKIYENGKLIASGMNTVQVNDDKIVMMKLP
jgi:hypothetical protein